MDGNLKLALVVFGVPIVCILGGLLIGFLIWGG